MKLLQGMLEILNLFFSEDYDDPYTEYLSEQPGVYLNLNEFYDNQNI